MYGLENTPSEGVIYGVLSNVVAEYGFKGPP